MRIRIDIVAGASFVMLGGAFGAMALNYNLGSAARMGPGFFPFGVSAAMVALGCALIFQTAVQQDAGALALADLKRPAARLLVILTSIVLFGLLLGALGLVICIALLTTAASIASADWRIGGLLARIVVLSAISWAIFVYALRLQLPIWPSAAVFGGL